MASKDGIWDNKEIKKILSQKLHQDQKWLLYNFERWYAINFHKLMQPIEYKIYDKIKRKLQSIFSNV